MAASQCLQESGWKTGGDEAHYVHEFAEIVAARVLIAGALSQGEPKAIEVSEALGTLASLLQAAETARRTGSVIKILALQALAFYAQNDLDQAMPALERALSLSVPEGYIRTFVDEGEPMAQLLYKALARGIAPDYVRRLLAAFPAVEQEQTEPKTRPSQSELIESLSERELEVLGLIAEGLTNREVAGRLYLSLNTVKAHTRSIYGKLDVHTRTQAVARGRNLRLLPSH